MVVRTPAEAARLGAEAVIMFLVLGSATFSENLATVARTVEEVHAARPSSDGGSRPLGSAGRR